MTTAVYRIELPFAKLLMRCNLAEASAPIELANFEYDGIEIKDDFSSIGMQSADARHGLYNAAVLCLLSCGTDYWLDPSERDVAAAVGHPAYVLGLIRSVREVVGVAA